MKEETTENATEAKAGSVFARVLAGFMEERDIPATPESFAKLAEKAGLDIEVFRARLDGDMEAVPGELSGVADELGLTEQEMMAVAVAFTYEKEHEPERDLERAAGKTVGELCEEQGLTYEEMARDMEVSERAVMLLESSGQKYLDFNQEWGVPVSEPYGLEKVFWLEPAKAVREWEEALRLLRGLMDFASNTLDNQALLASLGDATIRARQELAGCRELLANFERQEEQIRSETVED